MARTDWYKDMVFYQIWPRSFCDGNGDGVGDLWGVLQKLDYVKSLGVTGIWFSPLYPSPNADFGYDVSDYCAIDPAYGDLGVFDRVVAAAHERDLKVVMDLVINHTSSEHEWFRQALADADSPYHDYYFFRRGSVDRKGRRMPPNNWDSLLGGSAWEYVEALDEYYLHTFDKAQPDLNLDNPAVRGEVEDVMRFWLDRGVDGFREDVITFVSKPQGLPSDVLGLPGSRGLRLYNCGPRLRSYLMQFRRDVLDSHDCVVVGEAPMLGARKALALTAARRGERPLDLVIGFDHMQADCMYTEYLPRPFSLRKLKRAYAQWQDALGESGWCALYLENHDHPRVVSRYGSEAFRAESAASLAASYLFQRGTPFVYQGQELGMTNVRFDSIEQVPDPQAHAHYRRVVEGGKSPEDALALVNRAGRDNARSPMQWTGEKDAGFCPKDAHEGPWVAVNPNHVEVNVAAEDDDLMSPLNFYRRAIRLRRLLPVVRSGRYHEFKRASSKLYVYARESTWSRLLVMCSFSDEPVTFHVPDTYGDLGGGVLALSNYYVTDAEADDANQLTLRPWETRVYVFGRDAVLVD